MRDITNRDPLICGVCGRPATTETRDRDNVPISVCPIDAQYFPKGKPLHAVEE